MNQFTKGIKVCAIAEIPVFGVVLSTGRDSFGPYVSVKFDAPYKTHRVQPSILTVVTPVA